ncbi:MULTISPECIES: hypothetical protein [Rhodopseudomonas]|uniref:Uncharacterized protein n=1 Tax=Rhodopseudomonas palustris TaxID=1076 RepID=A0A0D7EQD5_RHOPL|nr:MULTISPECIES: hypothetical protein [Rhodopseudomonas]KIZ42735.1 hypothetical protein OO17_12280 [Rhodopseudomonas palustris]MDF3810839.1 hypothetical protein [Rhodopseudomonas sp. BAL398]WOK19239.1 hypothetical protein RBJ75_06905 [Rhodopseudomonas sp. BAL398]
MMYRQVLFAVTVLVSAGASVGGPAHAQFRSLVQAQDSRADFIRRCITHMTGRWAHPEAVCGCLHDHVAAAVVDDDLRAAVLRGISESGVPNIDSGSVPASKQSQISTTFTAIAKPTLQCMFAPRE